MRKILLTLSATAISATLLAQTITVKDTVMTTYPYSDPDPVANIRSIYPYWNFSGFSQKPQMQSWKMVVLENDFIRVKIFPEIGGKVWSICDKATGRDLVYDNDAVKFRNISHRGPWTSGGIEFNYGVIGHAPSCATPVDWKTETKPDGSVSCYIGVLEMTSRSRWTVEVNLPKDAAFCRTRSVWHNYSGEWQPYYSWANSGVETSEDLVLIMPAENAVGHTGEVLKYPINEEGKDISILANQNYGGDKSYHMIGSHKSYFGAYYPSADWASMHWSLRDEKLGRKYFTWTQSRQGKIWKDLLTDNRPQYLELQSGRLFNQNITSCSERSPFRQVLFSPYGTEEWSDWWMPCSGIGIADNLTLDAAISVKDNVIGLYALRPLEGCLKITDAEGNELLSQEVAIQPAKPCKYTVNGKAAAVRIGRKLLWDDGSGRIDRPQTRSAEFDPESAEGHKLMGRDLLGMRLYSQAEAHIDKALELSPADVEALALKAALLYHRMQYAEAREYSQKGLAVDQYNAEAGYIGGLAAEAMDLEADAMDRYEVAAIADGALRQGCYTRLAKMHFRRGDDEIATDYACKALKCNAKNITALMILVRLGAVSAGLIESIDPLNHFPAAELFLAGQIPASELAKTFQSEMPWEDYLELAIFYHSMGLDKEASRLLGALPQQNALTALWIAYLNNDAKGVKDAESQALDFVFPFRSESAEVLQWALENGGSWRSSYLLATLKHSLGYSEEAKRLVRGNDADWAPYYAYRYKLTGENSDIRKAFDLEPQNWIYRRLLAIDLNKRKEYGEALGLLKNFYAANPENFQIGDILMDSYIGLGRYKDAEKIIDKIVYLPFEGMGASHNKYRHIKLHRAAQECDRGRYDKALSLVDEALLWPERLGAGKPYDDLIDTSKEEWVRSEILRIKDSKSKESLLDRLDDTRTQDRHLF